MVRYVKRIIAITKTTHQILLSGDISGNIRENLLQGVLDYLKQQLDETTEGLSSTLSLSLSSSVRIPSRRLKENVKKISEILATKVCYYYPKFLD